MALFKRRPQSRPMEALFYGDYLKSQAWEVRKKQYYSKYGKACTICGETDGVELNHLKYGNYGHERDRDLAALCRKHHQGLGAKIAGGGDLDGIADRFLSEETAKHDAEREERPASARYDYSPSPMSTVHMVLDMMARPIWRLFGVFRW